MATDFFGSSVQADAVQTLYHVNAKYPAYGNNCNPGHMGLLDSATGPVGHEGLLGSPVQHHHQHQFMEFSIPQVLTQMPVSNNSHLTSVSNANMSYRSNSANLLGSSANSRQYGWVVDNEFSFHPAGNMPESNQPLARRVPAVVSGQQSTSDLCHYSVEGLPPSLVQQQAQLISKIVTPESNNMDRLQSTFSTVGQSLSLSLSPQPLTLMQLQPLQQTESAVTSCQGLSNTDSDNLNREENFSNRYVGGKNYSMIEGTGYLNHLVSECSIKPVDAWSHQSIIGRLGSRYLKATQELLNEVVNVGRGMKSSLMKQTKLQAWIGPGSISDDSLEKNGPPSQFSSKDGNDMAYGNTGKENDPGVADMPTSTGGSAKANASKPVDLTPAESQELQTKKAKLLAMRDEVDQRYKQYHYQMQAAVGAFESAAGFGTARTYTALALETISKHFRSLRDAIDGQIRVTSKSLGEEEISGQGISKLRIVDQQLRQQRALRQLGMIQQHAWRPQRGLPEHAVSILRAWLFEHFLHPYPKDADKIMLARQTKLSRSQVSNWFINARVRLWKPMIEDLYLEELKERDSEGLDKSAKDTGANNDSAGLMDNMENNKPVDVKTEESFVTDGQGRDLAGYSSESFLPREDESGQQRSKRPRTEAEGLSTLPPAEGVKLKFGDEGHITKRDEQGDGDPHGTSLNDPGNQDFVSYEQFQLGAYSQAGSSTYSATSYPGTGGVSLTLGLQHCDVLSGAQLHYGQLQLHLPPGTRQNHPADYFSTDERNYLQNQKQFFSHMLRRDFTT